MPIQQKLTPPVLLFGSFAGWVNTLVENLLKIKDSYKIFYEDLFNITYFSPLSANDVYTRDNTVVTSDSCENNNSGNYENILIFSCRA